MLDEQPQVSLLLCSSPHASVVLSYTEEEGGSGTDYAQ